MSKHTADRLDEIADTMARAENTRCACGDYGSWDHTISGTSGMEKCVWAGCPNCSGSAIGVPVKATDLAWFRRQPASQRALRMARARQAVQRAAAMPTLDAKITCWDNAEQVEVELAWPDGWRTSALVLFDGNDVADVRLPSSLK